jgi:hypothetical protein
MKAIAALTRTPMYYHQIRKPKGLQASVVSKAQAREELLDAYA